MPGSTAGRLAGATHAPRDGKPVVEAYVEDASAERWLPVPGFEGMYAVSDLGRVRSLARKGVRKDRLMKPSRDRGGYFRVILTKDRAKTYATVHRLVTAAFIGPLPPGKETRHLDGDQANNALSNLTYGTRSENSLDMVRHGTHRQVRKTHCPKSHEYTPENTYIDPLGRRGCRRCKGTFGAVPHASRTHCPQGHEYTPENTYRDKQNRRYCKTCRRIRNREAAAARSARRRQLAVAA